MRRSLSSKWVVAALFFALAVFLFFWKPPAGPVKVELLPFSDSLPSWNGSYPFLIISLNHSDSNRPSFHTSVRLVSPTVRHNAPVDEFEVDLHSGMFIVRQTDLFVPDVVPLALIRTYRVWNANSMAFGAGTNHPYDIAPTGTRNPYTYMDINLEDGRQMHFQRISKGEGYANAVFRHEETSSEFYGAQVAWNGNGWNLDFKDGQRFVFPEAYYAKSLAQGAAWMMRDEHGRKIQLHRDQNRNLVELVSPSGKAISFKYDELNRIVKGADDQGNARFYHYDSSGHLETVSDSSQLLFRFEYQHLMNVKNYDPYMMTAIRDGNDKVLLKNSYLPSGQISEQKVANGDVYRYRYIFKKGEIVETIVDQPSGERMFYFEGEKFLREK